jgi:hypothetical protein
LRRQPVSIGLLVTALMVALAAGCSERRQPAAARQAPHRADATTRPSPADDYLTRAVLDMAAEDQERSEQSLRRESSVPYRDSPMRPPHR